MIILLFALLAFSFLLEAFNFKFKNWCFAFLLILLITVEAIKNHSGIDFTYGYDHYYAAMQGDTDSSYEYVYKLMVNFFSALKLPYPGFLLIYFSLVYLLYYLALSKFTEYKNTALLFLFCITIGLMGSNRQILALSIGMFASAYFLPRQKIYFALSILLAIFIHQSAFFLLPFILLNKRVDLKIYSYLLVFAFFMQILHFSKPVLNFLIFNFAPNITTKKAIIYDAIPSSEFSVVGFSLGVVRRLLPLILMLVFEKELRSNLKFDFVFNVLFLSLFTYILMYQDLEYIASRIGVYYLVFEAVLYSWFVPIIMRHKKKYLLISLYLFFCGFLIYKNTHYFPELFFPFRTLYFTF